MFNAVAALYHMGSGSPMSTATAKSSSSSHGHGHGTINGKMNDIVNI
jgi:hypothetical protein